MERERGKDGDGVRESVSVPCEVDMDCRLSWKDSEYFLVVRSWVGV